ncbi:MAG: helix-turn-helix domain-containing protein [Sphingobium sp.]
MNRPVLPLASMRPLTELMRAFDLLPEAILDSAGVDRSLLDPTANGSLALSDYFRICEQMALQSGDETFHVSMRPLMIGTSKFVQTQIRACRTLAEVMEVIAEAYNVIHGHRYNHVRKKGGTISFVIDDRQFPYALDHDDAFVILSAECLLIYVHALILSLPAANQQIPLRAIRTRSPRKPTGATHLSFWGVPVRYQSPVFALQYDASLEHVEVDLSRSDLLTSRTIYGVVAAVLDRIDPSLSPARSLAERVAQHIAAGRSDQAKVAAALGMSVASLRRHLGEDGVQFRDLRADVINRIARERLREGRSIADIAEELGFSDGRSFARAFRQWNGASPAEFRQI